MILPFVFTLLLGASTSSDLVAPQTVSNGQAVRLWCALERPNRFSIRYANLASLPGIDGEVALTAAHGLRDNQDCELRSGAQRIAARIHSMGDSGTPAEDWAVIRAETRFTSAVERFPVAITSQDRFTAMLKLSSTTHPSCEVSSAPEAFWWPDTVLLHGCTSFPGRSGAPLLAASEGETYLVGINLGSIHDADRGLGGVAYWRRVDTEIAEALLTAAYAEPRRP
jgi:hypothetical protein